MSVAIIGLPEAIASNRTIPKASSLFTEGNTTTPASLYFSINAASESLLQNITFLDKRICVGS
jgi:hypothetical protein